MSGLKEIRRRIVSVTNTKQITRAMKLVSAAKLRRAQEAAEGGRSFSRQLESVLADVCSDVPASFTHPLLQKSDKVSKRLAVVVGGERGLCGGYNTNLVKAVIADEAAADGVEVEYMLVGRRMVSAANSKGWKVYREHGGLPESVADWPTSDIARDIMTRFTSGEVDEVKLCFTEFKSAMTQEVRVTQLLPFAALSLEGDDSDSTEEQVSEDSDEEPSQNKYDPSPEKILEKLLPLLAQTAFVQAAFESKASEHAARMTAMDAATNNADELIEKLRLYYNRARQSTITSELIDIVGGAEALQ